jgi:hypothetical protein
MSVQLPLEAVVGISVATLVLLALVNAPRLASPWTPSSLIIMLQLSTLANSQSHTSYLAKEFQTSTLCRSLVYSFRFLTIGWNIGLMYASCRLSVTHTVLCTLTHLPHLLLSYTAP